MVTHDRYMLDRVSTVVLGLDGTGGAERFADYAQWEEWQREHAAGRESAARDASRLSSAGVATAVGIASPPSAKRRLSYLEQREFETIEQRIADAERDLQLKHEAFSDPAIMSDGPKLHGASLEMEAAQQAIDELYARWAELEQKANSVRVHPSNGASK